MELFRLFGKIAVDNSEANRAIEDTTKKSKGIGDGFKESKISIGKSLNEIAAESGKNINELKSDIMKLASEYKKQGMDASTATKKAYADFGYTAKQTHKNVEAEVKDTVEKIDEALGESSKTFNDTSQKVADTLSDTAGKAEHSESRMTSAFKKIGAAVATYLAADKIKEFGQACVDMSAEVSAEQSAFEQIMGDYSDTAQEKVNEIADATGMVNTRLTPYMTSMTAKFKGLGYDIGDATDYAKQGLNIAADAAAFWDKSLDDSMSALNSFVNGSYEGGEDIGLFANDTQMAAYAVKEGLVSEAKEWSKLEEKIKQATRLEYAEKMQKASGAVGQAAKESKQYANVQANLNEKWRQFKAQIGEPILQNIVLPAMDKLSGFITNKLSPGFDNLKKKVAENKDRLIALKDRFVDCGKYLINTFSPAFSSLKKLFITVKDAIKPIIERFLDFSESGESATKSTNLLKESVEFVSEAIKTASDIVSDFIKWLSGGSAEAEAFKSFIIGVSTAFVTYKGVMLATNTVMDKGKKAVDAYRKAQQLLNTTNPFGWAVIAISTLVGLETSLRKLPTPTEKIVAEFSKLSEEEQALVDETKELKARYEDLSEAFDSAMGDNQAEFDYYKDLSEELDNIVDKNGKIKEGYEDRAAVITGELSEALGIEIETTDGVIQKYTELHDNIEKVIAIKEAEAALDSGRESYMEAQQELNSAYETMIDNELKLQEVTGQLIAVESAKKDLTRMSSDEIRRAYGESADYASVTADLDAKIKGLTEKQGKYTSALNDSEDAYSGLKSTVDNYKGLQSAAARGEVDEVNKALDDLYQGFITCETGTERSLQNQLDNYKNYYEKLKTAQDKGNKNVTDSMVKDAKERYTRAETEYDKFITMSGEKGSKSGWKFAASLKEMAAETEKSGKELAQSGLNGVKSVDFGPAGTEAGNQFGLSLKNVFNDTVGSIMEKINSINISNIPGAVKLNVNIPKFTTLATGGIVDRATIAQIGEDGPEAVVPLKNNTEWIDRVAHKVAEAMGNGGTTVNYIFENVSINSDEDIEEYAYKLEAMRQKAALAIGGV